MKIKEDFEKLYREILDKYKDAFAIKFDKDDFPHQIESMYGRGKDELFTDFYIVLQNTDFPSNYDLLECAYYQYGDYDHGRFYYLNVSYEVLRTYKNITLKNVIEILPFDYLDIVDVDLEKFHITNEEGKVISDDTTYTKIKDSYYKLNDTIIISEENKRLLLEEISKFYKK
jgi:hypothetical protein